MAEPENVRILTEETLASWWGTLKKLTIAYARRDGREAVLEREVYDHGHAVAVLPWDRDRDTVLLVRQMRIAAWVTGHKAPLLEVCAGLVDGDDPEIAILREAVEELGARVHDLSRVAGAFASPGSVTEHVDLFLAAYGAGDRSGSGGGLADEGEDIEVVEMPLAEAFALIASGGVVDIKTITLLQAAWLDRLAQAPR